MKEFRSFHPSRRDLDFSQLDQDHPDEFYEIQFNTLVVEIFAVVNSAFCPGDGHKAPLTSPWLRDYPEEFIKYVELVAHSDARGGKWEKLLRDRDERSNLLQSIIFKILDTQIFSQLLFGASPKHIETLQNSDMTLINAEGFQRSKLRSHTNRRWLESSNKVPPRFWEEVDKLCTQTLTLLLPVYKYTATFTGHEPISIAKLHQLLHDVISFAGWLSVCIGVSPAIVSFNWLKPGDLYSMSTKNVNVCHAAYETSKEAALRHQIRLNERKPNSEPMESAARIKISVVPKILRHKPCTGSMASYTIMNPHVLYYEGLRHAQDENRAFISLPDYIKKLEDRNCAPRYAALAIMAIVLFCLCVYVYFTPSGHRLQWIQQWSQQWSQQWVESAPGPTPTQEPEPEPSKWWWKLRW